MSKGRHTLENLEQIAEWICSNDMNNKQSDSWEQLHKKVMDLPDGTFLDISNIKTSSKGSRMIKQKPESCTSHESLPLVWTVDGAFDIYKKGTGLD